MCGDYLEWRIASIGSMMAVAGGGGVPKSEVMLCNFLLGLAWRFTWVMVNLLHVHCLFFSLYIQHMPFTAYSPIQM